uniref:Uncharacterized protein n=1 Tax=Fagus sylvatica TaxID=28930 RepID=A0A2N9F1R1_FAGSY
MKSRIREGLFGSDAKGRASCFSFSFRSEARAVALQVELKHDRNMDLAAAAEAIGD